MKHALLLVFTLFFTLGLGAQASATKGISAEDLQVYPNPVVEYFKLGQSERVKTLSVNNLLGREIRRFECQPGQQYFIGDLPRGYYLVQLRDQDQRVIKTVRVAKRD